MSNRRQYVGRWGEDKAVEYLSTHDYKVIERNFRSPQGEIDVIARQDDLIVFIEVKTRTSSSYALPEMSVTTRKQAHMLAAAEYYLEKNPHYGDNWQFDILSVEGKPGKEPVITHFENVIG